MMLLIRGAIPGVVSVPAALRWRNPGGPGWIGALLALGAKAGLAGLFPADLYPVV